MKRPCPIILNKCPGADFPITNASSEAPDPILFAGIGWTNFDPYAPPPLGNGIQEKIDCSEIVWSTVSQELADLFAQINSDICQPPVPPVIPGSPPLPTPPEVVIPGFEWTPDTWNPTNDAQVFGNDRQSASINCPDGSVFFLAIEANTVTETLDPAVGPAWVAYINAYLLAYILQQLYDQRVCVTVPDVPNRIPPGTVPPTPPPPPWPIANYPGWVCFGEALNPALFTYEVGTSTGDWTFSLTGGSLPPGTSLIQTGPRSAELQGAPTTPGTYTFTLQAIAGSSTCTINDTVHVFGISNGDTLPEAAVGVDYSEQLQAAGGTGPYTFSASGLPAWLTLQTDGTLSGTPVLGDEGITYSFAVTTTDANGVYCTDTISVSVEACTWTITPDPLPDADIGVVYSQQLVVSAGGTGPYTFTIDDGALPTGFAMSAAGLITCANPSVNETANFTVKIVDSLAVECSRDFSITVVGFTCGATATNIQDVVWTLVSGSVPGCGAGTIVSGSSSDWYLHKTNDPFDSCYFGDMGLQWRGTICNPGAAYDITVNCYYVSSGTCLAAGCGIRLGISIIGGAPATTQFGSYSSDTPNPLSVTITLPAYSTSVLAITVESLGAAGPFYPPAGFLNVDPTSPMTITPLLHP